MMGFTTYGISNNVKFFNMMLNTSVIVFDGFQRPPLLHIELFLGEYVIKAFVIGENSTWCTEQIVAHFL